MSPSLLAQIAFQNQLEYTRWQAYDRNILENWSDLTYHRKSLQMGLRYEINRPPDPFIFPQDTLLQNYELTFRFAEVQYKNLSARIGNFYAIFGRGLTLRTYEDRNLRVDNNLDGIKLNFSGQDYKLQLISGKMRDKYNRRKNILYGFDSEVSAFTGFHLGASYLFQDRPENKIGQLLAARMNLSYCWFDFYAETVFPELSQDPSFYLALNLASQQMALSAEYKDYNRLSFQNFFGTEYNAAPSLTREHAFAALNRHPHFLNQNNERGYQLETTYLPTDTWEIILNHSQTFTLAQRSIFEEYYGEIHHLVSEKLEYRLAADWNSDFTTRTENITPLADITYNLSERDQIHFSYQHQHTKNTVDKSEYDNELALLEYSHSPFLTLALVGEYTNKYKLRNVQLDRHTWLYGNVTFNFWRNQQLTVLYGSRQEGFICVGGICRYEPEFEGLEIKLTTRF